MRDLRLSIVVIVLASFSVVISTAQSNCTELLWSTHNSCGFYLMEEFGHLINGRGRYDGLIWAAVMSHEEGPYEFPERTIGVECINATDGTVLWNTSVVQYENQWGFLAWTVLTEAYDSEDISGGDQLFIGFQKHPGSSGDGNGYVSAIDKTSGELLWTFEPSEGYHAFSYSLAWNGRVLINTDGRGIYFLNASTGKELELHTRTPGDGYALIGEPSLDVTSGLAFYVFSLSTLHAVSAVDGTTVWRNNATYVTQDAAPCIFNSSIVFALGMPIFNQGPYPTEIVAIDLHTGKTMWKRDGFNQLDMCTAASTPAAAANTPTLVLARGHRHVFALDALTGVSAWNWTIPPGHNPGDVSQLTIDQVHGGRLVAIAATSIDMQYVWHTTIYLLRSDSGAEIAQFCLPGFENQAGVGSVTVDEAGGIGYVQVSGSNIELGAQGGHVVAFKLPSVL